MKKDEKNEEKKTHEPLVLCDILAFKTETSLVPCKGISKGAEKIFPELEGGNAKEQGASQAAENPHF